MEFEKGQFSFKQMHCGIQYGVMVENQFYDVSCRILSNFDGTNQFFRYKVLSNLFWKISFATCTMCFNMISWGKISPGSCILKDL